MDGRFVFAVNDHLTSYRAENKNFIFSTQFSVNLSGQLANLLTTVNILKYHYCETITPITYYFLYIPEKEYKRLNPRPALFNPFGKIVDLSPLNLTHYRLEEFQVIGLVELNTAFYPNDRNVLCERFHYNITYNSDQQNLKFVGYMQHLLQDYFYSLSKTLKFDTFTYEFKTQPLCNPATIALNANSFMKTLAIENKLKRSRETAEQSSDDLNAVCLQQLKISKK